MATVKAAAAVALLGALVSAPAKADFSWSFNSSSCGGGSTCTVSDTDNGQTVTGVASAWSASTSSSSIGSTSLNEYSTGLGAGSGSAPLHALDNNGKYESLLYQFNASIAVDSVSYGYWDNDADFHVLAYTGAAPFDLNTHFSGQDYNSLIGLGWQLMGTNQDKDNLFDGFNSGPGATYSSVWLVAAGNTAYDGGCCAGKKDYIKVKTLAGKMGTPPPPGVPVPGSPALVLIALAALGWNRRCARRRAA